MTLATTPVAHAPRRHRPSNRSPVTRHRRFVLELQARDQGAADTVNQRIRLVLRVASRVFGFKCLSARETPREPRDALVTMTVAELRARVRELELANFQAERRAEDLGDELAASQARERFLSLRLSQQMKRTAAACVAAGEGSGR